MLLALEKLLAPATGRPVQATPGAESKLDISVVATSAESTLTALKKACALAERLGARITLVVPQVVPFPLPLTSPPVLLDFSERRFREIARQSTVEIAVHIYLCRDQLETLALAMRPRSVVVLGGRKGWWPTRERVLARKLRRLGYEVVFAETE